MEILTATTIFILGSLFGYLTSYMKSKGQNKALLEDISKLENEKQKIQIKYSTELEEHKKTHALEIELRKHKYQDKRDQFTKYFSLLDAFHGKSNKLLTEKFPPIFNRLLTRCLSDTDNSQEAFSEFSIETHKIFNALNEDHLKLSTETRSIRLISSPAVDILLDQLESEILEANNGAQEIIKTIATPDFWEDQRILLPAQKEIESSVIAIKSTQQKLIAQMKNELSEI